MKTVRASGFITSFVVSAIGAMAMLPSIPAHAGVVTLTGQNRSVLVTTSGAPISLPPEMQQQSAPDFGPFDASVSTLNFTQPLPGILSTVSQNSSITLTPDDATILDQANLGGSITENALPGQSDFSLSFTLSQPEPFTASYVGLYGDGRSIGQDGTIVNGEFTGPGAPGLMEPVDLHTYNRGEPLMYSGILQPGNFSIQANLDGTANTGFLSLTVDIGPAVPLPSAAWAMLATLPLICFAIRRYRRVAICSVF
jgi:hypothetical protein